MSDVFISYSSNDREEARRLADALEASGISVWWDRQIPPGRTYDEVIEEALGSARCVVVLWSESSVGSDWVKTEAAVGYQRKALVPAMLEPVDIPLEFRRVQAADLMSWRSDPTAPGLERLVRSVQEILDAPAQIQPPAESALVDRPTSGIAPSTQSSGGNLADLRKVTRKGLSPSRRRLVGIGAAVAVAAVGVVAFMISRGGDGDTLSLASGLTQEEAAAELELLVDGVPWREEFVTQPARLPIPTPSLSLPPIDDYPVVVEVPSAFNTVTVEVWVSSEKAGEGTDGWFVEAAEAFNRRGSETTSGAQARIAVRRIASGTAYQFIAARQNLPQAYSPSNHLWIEMAKASGVEMTPISDQLVENVAGLVLRTEKANELEALYGPLDAEVLIDSVIEGNLVMGYTDPFASSTGLNFLMTVLLDLSGGDAARMLSPDVAAVFEQFQYKVPFVALTTLQIRDSVLKGGQLDAFVMEYQTFVAEPMLTSGFEFIPFGISHDNPLYAVGDISEQEREVLDLFASFAQSPEYEDLARRYGFDPPAYRPSVTVPSGEILIAAQQLWKERKDGGRPLAAVFVADVSGSMAGNRIQAVRAAMTEAVSFISEDSSIGMVTFSDRTTHVLPIARFDIEQQGLFVAAIRGMDTTGGTAMYDGIAVALSLLLDEVEENPDAKPIVIVLTDGETQAGLSFDEISDVVRGLRIPIYTVGFEADLDELARLSGLVEAASINADIENVEFRIGSLFNAQL